MLIILRKITKIFKLKKTCIEKLAYCFRKLYLCNTNFKANHNKDFSVVKTLGCLVLNGAFFMSASLLITTMQKAYY